MYYLIFFFFFYDFVHKKRHNVFMDYVLYLHIRIIIIHYEFYVLYLCMRLIIIPYGFCVLLTFYDSSWVIWSVVFHPSFRHCCTLGSSYLVGKVSSIGL